MSVAAANDISNECLTRASRHSRAAEYLNGIAKVRVAAGAAQLPTDNKSGSERSDASANEAKMYLGEYKPSISSTSLHEAPISNQFLSKDVKCKNVS